MWWIADPLLLRRPGLRPLALRRPASRPSIIAVQYHQIVVSSSHVAEPGGSTLSIASATATGTKETIEL